ncbi:MAG: hypothetical protein HKN23_14520 [Verrucomicrobiales bacterium]|nr:hypothetical protein [Verrucomicrobiales bacterium]
MNSRPAIFLLSMAGLFSQGAAQNPSAPEIPLNCLPVPLSPENFSEVKTNSPFTRVLSLSDLYFLTGVAQIDGKPVATLKNRKTEKTVLISDTPNEQGWKLVGVDENTDITKITATISIGDGAELTTVQFSESQLKPAPKKIIYDKWGRAVPSQKLIDKFRSLNREQMGVYQAWRARMVKKNPEMDKSHKRFPIIEKAMDAILAGQKPKEF